MNTVYDSLGRTLTQYVPTFETFNWNYNLAAGWNTQPKTTTAYDTLGRPVRVVNTDGTVVSSVYNGLYTAQVDANGHYHFSAADDYGRTTDSIETLTTFEDPFNNTAAWTTNGTVIESGTLRTNGVGSSYASSFYTATTTPRTTDGIGIKIEFKVNQTDSGAFFSLENNSTYPNSNYRRFGLYVTNVMQVQQIVGGSVTYPVTILPAVEANTWYVLTLKVTNTGWAYVEVWKRDDPSKRGGYLFTTDGSVDYRFHHWIANGSSWVDNYQTLTFEQMHYTYDVTDQLLTVVDTLGATTTLAYNTLGQKLTLSDPDMGKWTYRYDALGNLITQFDAKKQGINSYYDIMNRLVGQVYVAGPLDPTTYNRPADPGYAGYTVGYRYDDTTGGNLGKGLRTKLENASGNTTWFYNNRGLVTSESKTITGSGTFRTQYTYDAADRLLTMTYPGDNANGAGEVVNYTYTDAGLLNTVIGTNTYVYGTTYDASSRMDYQLLGANAGTWILKSDYTYNAWTTQGGRLQQLAIGTSGSPTSIQDLRYTYDPVGNVLTIADYKAGSPQTQTFTYDALDRLRKAVASGGTNTVGDYTDVFTYTATGNIAATYRLGNYTYSAGTSSCSAGSTVTRVHAVSAVSGVGGNKAYNYDCNGNITTRTIAGSTYSCASSNQMGHLRG